MSEQNEEGITSKNNKTLTSVAGEVYAEWRSWKIYKFYKKQTQNKKPTFNAYKGNFTHDCVHKHIHNGCVLK